jgi:osmotically-inducible protein OsmY
LSHSANIELRRVQVEVTEDEVILLGRVSSFYMKQLAQEAVLTLAEGRRIVNLVEVCRN